VISKVTALFQDRFGSAPQHIARAPGRVNLLGEHVDYNDGFVLPAAIDRTLWVAFSPSNNDRSTLFAADFSEEVSFSSETIGVRKNIDNLTLPQWALYPAGVSWALSGEGYSTPPMMAAFLADIPRGSGISSSAAVEMAFAVAWQTLGGWEISPLERALLGLKAENHYVGVNCGIMDQFASACGQADRLLYLDCRSMEYCTLPLPEDVAIIIADTGMRRSLTNTGYNDRRKACEEAVRILSGNLQGMKALRDISINDFNHFCSQLPEVVQKRARHVVEEMDRSCRAVSLLERGAVAEFGKLMNECHRSLRDLYEVSIPELDKMVEIAQDLPGCFGARLTGAGFGGCTVNLVELEAAADFAKELEKCYWLATQKVATISICRASDVAGLIF
jgi:galactokinase